MCSVDPYSLCSREVSVVADYLNATLCHMVLLSSRFNLTQGPVYIYPSGGRRGNEGEEGVGRSKDLGCATLKFT